MILVNCLWVGVLAGLVEGRLLRRGMASRSAGSSVAVGVLGGLLGGLSRNRLLAEVGELPHADILAAAIGAAVALALWVAAQRLCLNWPCTQSRSHGR